MSKSIKIEQRLLVQSVIMAIVFAVIGIVTGILAKSQMIIFDGLYSLVSVGLSMLSLLAMKFMSKNDYKKYPFGKDIVDPLVVIVEYSVLLITISGSIFEAVKAILSGGRAVNLDVALWYSVLSTILCFLMYFQFKSKSKKFSSGILVAESSQWLFDAIASAGVLVTFVAVYIFKYFNIFNSFLPYIDPIMVIVLGVGFARLPIISIGNALKEVLDMAPEGELASELQNMVKGIEKKYHLKESFLRVSQARERLWVEVDFVVDKNSKVTTIYDQDLVREEISQTINHLGYDNWLTVAFTVDRKWAI